MEKLQPALFSKELLFFWVDTGAFVHRPEGEQKEIAEEILSSYCTQEVNSLGISKERIQELRNQARNGPPFPKDLFDAERTAVFQTMCKDIFPQFVQNCALAAIYRKRRWDLPVEVPKELFTLFLKESQLDPLWKEMYRSEEAAVHRRKFDPSKPFYTWREHISIKAPPNFVMAFFRDVSTRHRYDKILESAHVLENLGDDSDIVFMSFSIPAPFAKKRDMVLHRCMTKTENGTWLLILSSVDHPKAITDQKKYIRIDVRMMGYVIAPSPTDPNETLWTGAYEMNLRGNKILNKLIHSKSGVRPIYDRICLFKKIVEEDYQKSRSK